MPPIPEIKTIEHMIFYQYAKVIAKRAYGEGAKKTHFGFIKNTARKLISGEKKWSDISREDWQFVDADKACFYCDSKENLEREHIVPKSISIKSECSTCERILGIHNQIWACRDCNGAGGKGKKGLYTFHCDKHPNEKKPQDIIDPLVEKKYLKTIYHCHECNGTLHSTGADGDITYLDIDCCIK